MNVTFDEMRDARSETKKRRLPQLHRADATAADDENDLHSVDADADAKYEASRTRALFTL